MFGRSRPTIHAFLKKGIDQIKDRLLIAITMVSFFILFLKKYYIDAQTGEKSLFMPVRVIVENNSTLKNIIFQLSMRMTRIPNLKL